MRAMGTFLLKTEPGTYSYNDLVREKKTAWTGVSNAAAAIHHRSARIGDECFIYHTGDEKAIVGLARVVAGPYEDPKAPGKTPAGEPKNAVIDLAPVKVATTPLTLATIKQDPRFKDFAAVETIAAERDARAHDAGQSDPQAHGAVAIARAVQPCA